MSRDDAKRALSCRAARRSCSASAESSPSPPVEFVLARRLVGRRGPVYTLPDAVLVSCPVDSPIIW